MGNQISFTVTESELQRQESVRLMLLSLDPRGKADAITVILLASIYFVDFLAIGFLLWNRNYPPLKSKGPFVMTLMMIVCTFWFVGDLQANGHLPLANTVFFNCKMFGFWLRLLLGACTMCVLTSFRAYGLYRVFFLNLPYHTVGLYLPFAIYYTCLLIYGVIIQVLNPAITIYYVETVDLCDGHPAFKAVLFVFLWLTWVGIMGIFWKIRNIKSSFNESREMLITCAIILCMLVYVTVMNYVYPLYPLNLSLRIVTSLINHLATNVLWWLVMAVPMYNCMFNRQEYLSRWILKLRRDGLQNEYDIAPNASGGHSRMSLSSYNARNNVLRSSIGGKWDKGFLPMDNVSGQSKEANYRLSSQNNFPRPPESPIYGYNGAAYVQGSQSMSATDLRQEITVIEARPESLTFNASNRF